MDVESRRRHWQGVYGSRREDEVSWFEESPAVSLELMAAAGTDPLARVIDIGGGASRLVDRLLEAGYEHVTVLDLSESALSVSRARLGERAGRVRWLAADVVLWSPDSEYDLWHDRAVFHFLTEGSDRAAYVSNLSRALASGGHAIIGTFAEDGPTRCSGLPVVRYSATTLSAELGPDFELLASRAHSHMTPWQSVQSFQFSLFRRH